MHRTHTTLTRIAFAAATTGAALAAASAARGAERFWNQPEGGRFDVAENWDDGSGEVPGAEDVAIFDLAAAYVVEFRDYEATDRLLVRRGEVRFDMGSSDAYVLLNPEGVSPGLVVGEDGEAALALDPVADLRAAFATLGLGADAAGTLTIAGVGARLACDGDVQIGFEGTGTLEVSARGSAAGRNVTLGTRDRSVGAALLGDQGSALTCDGRLAVGANGHGMLLVEGGADVLSFDAVVARQSGSSGDVIVRGLGSSWVVLDSLDVGMRGLGLLTIEDGAKVLVVGFATVGTMPEDMGPGVGFVTVDGVSSSMLVQGDLVVGMLGDATLVVSRGGRVEVDGDLRRVPSFGSTRLIIGLASGADYPGAALLVGGSADGFAPEVELLEGFVPASGDRFEIVRAAGGVGTYAFDLPALPGGLVWEVEQGPEHVALVVAPACTRADVDGDGVVDVSDILAVLMAWGECPGCPADVDGNGVVDYADVLAVVAAWGPCP